MNNIFAMPVGLRGTSIVWRNNTKIGTCLTSSSPVLVGSYIPLNEISVMDNEGERLLSKNSLKTITEIMTDIYEINPEHEGYMLLDIDGEEVTYLGERIIRLLYLSHRDEFLVIGVHYSIANHEKIC